MGEIEADCTQESGREGGGDREDRVRHAADAHRADCSEPRVTADAAAECPRHGEEAIATE